MVNFTYFGEGGRRGLWEGPKSETETLILVISQVKAICGFHCLSLFIGFLSISTFKCLFKAFLHLFWIPLQCSSLHCSQGLFHHLFIIHHHLNHLHHGHNPFPHITMVMIIHHISHCNNHNNENSQRTFLTYPPPPTMYCSPTSLPATSLYASTDVPGHHDPHTQAASLYIFSQYFLQVCTFIKSVGSIYISYAFAKGVDSVAFEFCTFYEVCKTVLKNQNSVRQQQQQQ